MKKITFPISGKTLYSKPVSVKVVALKLQRKYPMPQPPVQEVKNPDGSVIRERNYAHPDYQKQLDAWESFIEAKAGQDALQKARKFTVTDEMRTEVELWKKENDDWDESDSIRDLWLENIAIQSDEDFDAFMEYLGASEPKQEETEEIQDGFSG